MKAKDDTSLKNALAFRAVQEAIVEEVLEKLPAVMTIGEFHVLMKTSTSNLRRRINTGSLVGQRLDGRWIIRPDENREYIRRRLLHQMERARIEENVEGATTFSVQLSPSSTNTLNRIMDSEQLSVHEVVERAISIFGAVNETAIAR